MAKISRDRISATLHPRENLLLTGNIGSLNAEVLLDCHGAGTVSVDLRGTFSLSLEVSGTVDGTNWTVIPMKPFVGGQFVATITGSVTGVWRGACDGFDKLRVRCTAYTSGNVVATLLSSLSMFNDAFKDTPLIVTSVGAAGAAVTLTLPAPGAGLRNYITFLIIGRFATALLTAAATPVTVTTTNLPGSLAFSFSADATAAGLIDRWREDFNAPLASSAQNTATTIVAPITTGVLWRITAGYFVAP